MRAAAKFVVLLSGILILAFAPRLSADDRPVGATAAKTPAVIRIGAVAYAPSAVTIFEGIRRYFDRNGLPVDYVLYSNYDALVDALAKGQVDIAWNTPLAHARYHRKAGDASQALVMRDVDCNFRSVLIVRTDADVRTLGDLAGKTLVLGSRQAAEATVLPLHFLKQEGLDLKAGQGPEPGRRGRPARQPVLQRVARAQGPAGGARAGRDHRRAALEPPRQGAARPGQRPEGPLGLAPVQPLRLHGREGLRPQARRADSPR